MLAGSGHRIDEVCHSDTTGTLLNCDPCLRQAALGRPGRNKLRQAVLKRAVSRHTQQLVNLCYDTPGLSLHRRGIALRLLRSLGTLQDELGQLHDLADAGVLLMHCAGDDFF